MKLNEKYVPSVDPVSNWSSSPNLVSKGDYFSIINPFLIYIIMLIDSDDS
jgi:hypothetical protein